MIKRTLACVSSAFLSFASFLLRCQLKKIPRGSKNFVPPSYANKSRLSDVQLCSKLMVRIVPTIKGRAWHQIPSRMAFEENGESCVSPVQEEMKENYNSLRNDFSDIH